MGAQEEITRYRPDLLTRWWPPCLGVVTLGLWSYVIVRDVEYPRLPAAVAISLVLSAVAGWISLSRGVTFAPDALIIRTHRGTTALAWSDITTLDRRWNIIWVMTAKGWFVLPVVGNRRPSRSAAEARNLGDAIWWTWLERRGHDWAPSVLDPWEPTLDLKGRAVLRPPVESRLYAIGLLGGLLGTSLVPNQPAGSLGPALGLLVGAFVVVGLATGLYHWWARVTVDADEIVARSVILGVVRVPRGHVRFLREGEDALGLGPSGRKITRLVFDIHAGDGCDPWPEYRRTVRLPAPATTQSWYGNDPEYYRKWTWLHDELSRSQPRPWEADADSAIG